MTIDLDNIIKDGKLFGYETYFVPSVNYKGVPVERGPYTRIEKDGTEYEVLFTFDWNLFVLRIATETMANVPLGSQMEISLDNLFGLKDELIIKAVQETIDRSIRIIKTLEGKR